MIAHHNHCKKEESRHRELNTQKSRSKKDYEVLLFDKTTNPTIIFDEMDAQLIYTVVTNGQRRRRELQTVYWDYEPEEPPQEKTDVVEYVMWTFMGITLSMVFFGVLYIIFFVDMGAKMTEWEVARAEKEVRDAELFGTQRKPRTSRTAVDQTDASTLATTPASENTLRTVLEDQDEELFYDPEASEEDSVMDDSESSWSISGSIHYLWSWWYNVEDEEAVEGAAAGDPPQH